MNSRRHTNQFHTAFLQVDIFIVNMKISHLRYIVPHIIQVSQNILFKKSVYKLVPLSTNKSNTKLHAQNFIGRVNIEYIWRLCRPKAERVANIDSDEHLLSRSCYNKSSFGMKSQINRRSEWIQIEVCSREVKHRFLFVKNVFWTRVMFSFLRTISVALFLKRKIFELYAIDIRYNTTA